MTDPVKPPLTLEEFLMESRPEIQQAKPVAGLMARAKMERIVELSGTKCLCVDCRRLAKELKRELKRRKL